VGWSSEECQSSEEQIFPPRDTSTPTPSIDAPDTLTPASGIDASAETLSSDGADSPTCATFEVLCSPRRTTPKEVLTTVMPLDDAPLASPCLYNPLVASPHGPTLELIPSQMVANDGGPSHDAIGPQVVSLAPFAEVGQEFGGPSVGPGVADIFQPMEEPLLECFREDTC